MFEGYDDDYSCTTDEVEELCEHYDILVEEIRLLKKEIKRLKALLDKEVRDDCVRP